MRFDTGAYIKNVVLKEFLEGFEAKLAEYGNMHTVLGVKAQFVDIHRKVGKLERAWWDDVDTSAWREQPREIAMDLIGHLVLAVSLLDSTDFGKTSLPDNPARWPELPRLCSNKHCGTGHHTYKTGCIYRYGIGVESAPAGNSGPH